jgi:SlyX protein
MQQELVERIDHLESRLAFQDHTIEQLNQELTQQQRQLEKLRLQLDLLVNRMREMQVSQIASQAEETPPPHY